MEHSRRVVEPFLPDARQVGGPWRMTARLPRVNLLVVGPDHAVEEMLASVRTEQTGVSGDGPGVTIWRPGKPFVLPQAESISMMILRDVDTLVHADQHKLVDWLGQASGRVQVVSTASASLMPLVDAGVFLQTLYYRLNTVYLDLSDRRASRYDW